MTVELKAVRKTTRVDEIAGLLELEDMLDTRDATGLL